MKKLFFSAFLLPVLSFSQQPANQGQRWQVNADFYGATRYYRLDLDEHDVTHVTATLNGTHLTGANADGHLVLTGMQNSNAVKLVAHEDHNKTLAGTLTFEDTPAPLTYPFTAFLVAAVAKRPPQVHEFTPTIYYREYSAFNKPVLHIHSGDTIHTTTVDAGGNDEHGIKRIAGGDPETGPFYVEGALPGDTIAVHIQRLRLTRDTASSNDTLVPSALSSSLAFKTHDNNRGITWKLDRVHMTASPDSGSDSLRDLKIPLHPMLGCIAVAAPPADAPPPAQDAGSYGGNMDFNEMTEGTTVYLPVFNPGALLYIGDAHALQGDGELNGNALETSMDVTFTVDLIQGKRLGFPRLETPSQIVAFGYSGNLDDAFKDATSNMAGWLMDAYRLNASEVGQLLGVASQYRITEVADRDSGVALKIDKALLANLHVSDGH